MISQEQVERCEKEFSSAAALAFAKARDAERSLEAYTYGSYRNYDPARREKLLEAYRDADYEAESRAFILGLIQQFKRGEGTDAISVPLTEEESCASTPDGPGVPAVS